VLQRSIDDALSDSAGIDWAVSIRDANGSELACRSGDCTMKTASVGKLLLLVEVARQCDAGMLSGATMLDREQALGVADSGLWQHLAVEALSIEDLCVLIASVSDNLATNAVLGRLGLHSVAALCESLGLAHTSLLDFVRDRRGPEHPPTLSTGSASELSRLMSQLSRRELLSPAVSERVNGWLATGVDLSMVASAFGLDPLSHASARNVDIRNKTGADPGIRADVGTIARGMHALSYAVIANWNGVDTDLHDVVLSRMNAIGAVLRTFLQSE
jgi:beta-lactamase class A